MKKTRSLLALLLLGGMVLAGCGNKDKDTIPGDSGTPTQSGGGDQGGSSGGGSSGGGDQGGQQGGGQQGGEGGGQQGGGGQGGEVPTDSQFVNKKFVFDSVNYPDNAAIAAGLTANYQGAYAALFQNGRFELVSVVNTFTMALLGEFTVAEDDSYARLDVRKEYDGETQAYDYLESNTFVTNIRFNDGLQKYVMPMRQYIDGVGLINFDVYLTLSNELPEAADLPSDPNGDGFDFDPAHQVYKDVWDRLIVNRGLLHAASSNYKVTYDTTIFEVDDGTKFYEHYTNGAPSSGSFWERTSIEGAVYNYTNTILSGGAIYSSSPVEYGIDFFDKEVGLAPIPFNWMTYNSVGQYYYRSSFTYQNSWYGSITVNDYRVWFGANYRINKITYTDNAQQTWEFNFSDYNQVDLDLDDLTNGGGGGGGGQQQTDQPTDYYQYVQNKTLSYNRVSNTEDLTSEELQYAAAANANIAVGVFNDLSIEMQWPDHFYYDGENCSMSVLMYGSLQFSSFGTLSGRRVARGSVTITGLFINGADESGSPHEMPAMWDIENNQFVIKMDDPSNGDQYYLFLDTSNTAPTHIPQPEPPQSQLASFKLLGVNNDWTVGISGTDATNQAEVTGGYYVEQRKFDFTAVANEEIKVNSGDTWLGYDSLELGCQALATRVNGGQEDNNIRLNEGGNYSLYLKLHSDSTYSIWLVKENTPTATWPSAWVDALYVAWGITTDVIPECGTTGVTSFMTSPDTPSNVDTYGVIAAIGGAGLYDSYVAALGVAGYAPNAMGYYVSTNKELMILPQVSAGSLSILILPYDSSGEISDPSLVYNDGYNTNTVVLEFDSIKNEYYIEDIFLYEEYEFFLYIPNEGAYYFDDFVVRSPDDTSKGNISQGSEVNAGKYALYVEEDGVYDIYLNSSREIDVVYDIIPLLQYGSDLGGWDYMQFTEAGGVLQVVDVLLAPGDEVVIHLSENVWLHFEDYDETAQSQGKIGGSGTSNLMILEEGYYTFYVENGRITVDFLAL